MRYGVKVLSCVSNTSSSWTGDIFVEGAAEGTDSKLGPRAASTLATSDVSGYNRSTIVVKFVEKRSFICDIASIDDTSLFSVLRRVLLSCIAPPLLGSHADWSNAGATRQSDES